MAESIDVYSDQFMVSIGPYGASPSFALSTAHPEPTAPKPAERVATIRMSVEHLKVMTMIILRHVRKIEAEMGVAYQVPSQLLAQMGIAREDWDKLWAK